MSLDQKEVLQNLITQRNDVEDAINKLQGQLEQGRTQYLKLSGAIDVLSQLLKEEVPEEVDSEEEVVSEEE